MSKRRGPGRPRKRGRPSKKSISAKKLREYHNKLKVLHEASPQDRKELLNNKQFVDCVCQCMHNIIRVKVPISHSHKVKLSKHKKNLRELMLKKTTEAKRRVLKQRGGFLGSILGAAVPIIGNLLGGLFGGKR